MQIPQHLAWSCCPLPSATLPLALTPSSLYPSFFFFSISNRSSARNPKTRKALLDVIEEAGVSTGCPKSMGALLNTVASKFPNNAIVHRKFLLDYITSEKIKSNLQVEGAHEYLADIAAEPINIQNFEQAAGVGVVVPVEDILPAVAGVIAANEEKLREERYHTNLNILLAQVRSAAGMKWADPMLVKATLEEQVEAFLGPKTEADMGPPPDKKKKKKAEKKKEDGAANANGDATSKSASGPQAVAAADEPPADPFTFLPRPEDNNKVHTTVNWSDGRPPLHISNTPEQLERHLAATQGKVITRFPPEPNGYLHIGHAKAMFIDFGMARRYNGGCYLRFDDTNPEAEKQEYIDHIQEIVSWLGWSPFKITYSSDYFQELYELAVKLIETGNAYVCHQSGDEIKEYREQRKGSPWRDRPIEESLKLFDDMKKGLVEEGAAVLRMKGDPNNENYNMFDLIAYRIKFTPHPKAGDEWCIYPSYDFTHCIVDSLEDITHSMCTLEFESRRASYFWLLHVLEMYKPVVWEYSRLNITNTVLSKRKLLKLVQDEFVSGWDDPRLLTLSGLRRRGVRPEAINAFCKDMGVTRSEGEMPLHRLDYFIRTDLEEAAARRLAVLRPLRIVITNLPEDHYEEVEGKHFPGKSDDDGGYKLPLTRVVYIETTDFREEDEKGYYGLAPNKAVMLRYAYPITCTGVSRRDGVTGQPLELTAECDRESVAAGKKPPKGVLNWVSQSKPGVEPEQFEARLYGMLFNSPNPSGLGDKWLSDLNPDSLEVVRGAMASPVLAADAGNHGAKFQLERLGYFAVDTDSQTGGMVMNRICTLKDSFVGKAGGKK
jgi:glutaminyl-tRNA synthetase